MEKTLFTIGSSRREKEEFVDLLRQRDITLLIDVRSKNGSRVLHFDQSRFRNLSTWLSQVGITYDASLHTALGGLQNGKMTLAHFRDYMGTEPFHEALARLELIILDHPGHAVILCSEKDPNQCHRRLIGDALAIRGWHVVHIT